MEPTPTAPEDFGDATFTIGPPHPVTDSRQLPAVDAQDEASLVSGADLAGDHPDNTALDPDDPEVVGDPADQAQDEPEDLPGDDELASLVAEVDADDVDGVGFDDSDASDLPGLPGLPGQSEPAEAQPATTGGS